MSTEMRYLVFGGETYYARGGAHDLLAVYEYFEQAKEFAINLVDTYRVDWFHIANAEGGIVPYSRPINMYIIYPPNCHQSSFES